MCVHWYFRNIFRSLAVIFSQRPKVIFWTNCVFPLRYYATFKVRKFESLFCKINTCLQKTTTCNGFRAEQILSVNI